MNSNKFYLKCTLCGSTIGGFHSWFSHGQRCPECGSNQSDVIYTQDMARIKKIVVNKHQSRSGLWHYFEFLPLNEKKNIVSCGEGSVQIDRWAFLERYAKERYHIDCKVYAHRHDNNFATGTFKDLAGSMVASVLKENGRKSYVVASTGNVGVAYSRYLTGAGINLQVFIPQNSSKAQEAEIGCFGQKVFRVKGDYTRAKELAREFSQKYDILLAAGNYDPMRIEAKKVMVYEWLRYMDDFPTVYIQGLSGGTGPLAIAKACRELAPLHLVSKMPRFLLAQSDKCSPMADAWKTAKAEGFPDGWENSFPIYTNPQTMIPTLATGYPTTYPVLSKLVRESDGEIIAFPEEESISVARLVAYESAVRMGPAAAIAVGGFFFSLHNGSIRNGDIVMINCGEGMRRSPAFMEKLIYTGSDVSTIDECQPTDRRIYGKMVWDSIEQILV